MASVGNARRERRIRNGQICLERACGAVIRDLARQHGLSKSMIWKIVADIELLPPPPRIWAELVHQESGGISPLFHQAPGRGRAYRMVAGRRRYP